jgi:hypothetical protein
VGHRNRSSLGELAVKAGSSKQTIEQHLSTQSLAQPIEFEELAFCNTL